MVILVFLRTGQLKFMVIKMKYLYILTALLTAFVIAEDSTKIPIVKAKYLEAISSDKNFDNKIEYTFISDSLAVRKGNFTSNTDGFLSSGDYIYELEKGPISNMLLKNNKTETESLFSKKLLLKVLVDTNNEIFFTNGSFIVYFSEELNVDEFSSLNGLSVKRVFPSINAAVLTANDLANLDEVLLNLRNSQYVKDASFEIIDPRVIPE